MKNLYAMRHGRTNYNELGLCNDDPDVDVHLTDLGEQQAQAAAEKLRDIQLDRIIVSPLPRTRQTAEIINQYHHAPLNARVNGGESMLDHKQRVTGFIHWLECQPQKNILVVAHEETLRVFIAYFEGNVLDEQLRDIHIGNCEYRWYRTNRLYSGRQETVHNFIRGLCHSASFSANCSVKRTTAAQSVYS